MGVPSGYPCHQGRPGMRPRLRDWVLHCICDAKGVGQGNVQLALALLAGADPRYRDEPADSWTLLQVILVDQAERYAVIHENIQRYRNEIQAARKSRGLVTYI